MKTTTTIATTMTMMMMMMMMMMIIIIIIIIDTYQDLSIRRGMFQGDSLSSLLFVMALVAMTLVLRDAAPGYALQSKTKINHLLCMDDLKLYEKTKSDIDSVMSTVRVISNNISMRFGLQKYASVLKRGKRVEDEGIQLVDDQVIENLGIENYKYLGVLEVVTIKIELMKVKIIKEY